MELSPEEVTHTLLKDPSGGVILSVMDATGRIMNIAIGHTFDWATQWPAKLVMIKLGILSNIGLFAYSSVWLKHSFRKKKKRGSGRGTWTMATCKRTSRRPTTMEAAAMTAGPVRNLTAIAKAAVEFPHAIILGCNAMNSPISKQSQKRFQSILI